MSEILFTNLNIDLTQKTVHYCFKLLQKLLIKNHFNLKLYTKKNYLYNMHLT